MAGKVSPGVSAFHPLRTAVAGEISLMAYETPTKWSVFRFAVRRSYLNAAILTIGFAAVFLYRTRTATVSLSPMWVIVVLLGFYLFSLSLWMLRWYAYVARTKRAARKKGWGE
jgi:hypothetical protein